MILRKKGFTLIEMMVVIAIIAILAAALFPAIQGAINTAKASSYKQKGRGIWVGIVSANADREPIGKQPLWPGNGSQDIKNGAGVVFNPTNSLSTDYFQGLMVCDASGKPVSDTSMSYVSDLNPTLLGGLDWPALADGTFPSTGANNMWNMLAVSDASPSGDSFLISRNFGIPAWTPKSSVSVATVNTTNVTLNSASSLGQTRAIWVTRGGGCIDQKKLYLAGTAMFASTNSYTFITAAATLP